jgi:thiamine-phosphate pyrophosphorylase
MRPARHAMRIVVISPEAEDPRELPAMEGLFAAGLGRYHVRKPAWTRGALEAWLGGLPAAWRPRIVLHQHHALANRLGLGGVHERDLGEKSAVRAFSRSCHAIESLRASLPRYESLFFGPVFASLTKEGYGPAADFPWDALASLLSERAPSDARVLAIGGVTSAGLARCRELGFDGAAVLGAVWNTQDPVATFVGLRDAAAGMEAKRHAA